MVSVKNLGLKSFQTFIKPCALGPGAATKNAELSQTQALSARSSKSRSVRRIRGAFSLPLNSSKDNKWNVMGSLVLI